MRKGSITIPTFNWAIDVAVTKEVVAYAMSLGWKPNPANEATTGAVTLWFTDDMLSVIIITPDASPGIIAHEAYHSVRRMLLHVGAELDNEVVAYHLGYVVNHIHDIRSGPRKKRGKKNGTSKKSGRLHRRKA